MDLLTKKAINNNQLISSAGAVEFISSFHVSPFSLPMLIICNIRQQQQKLNRYFRN